ncbi:hypothetical protein V6N13_069853 [Hibiscus sabdariffa]
MSDVGNNKYLSWSLATANLPYYGINLGNGLPNGRFTNGRTVADINGFSNADLPCCSLGRNRQTLTCLPASLCSGQTNLSKSSGSLVVIQMLLHSPSPDEE